MVPSSYTCRVLGIGCLSNPYMFRHRHQRPTYLVDDGRCCRLVLLEERHVQHRSHIFILFHGAKVWRSAWRLLASAGSCLVQLRQIPGSSDPSDTLCHPCPDELDTCHRLYSRSTLPGILSSYLRYHNLLELKTHPFHFY